MNRKKKLTQIHKKRLKAARAKGAPSNNKARYISKAERAELASQPEITSESETQE